MRVQYIHRRYAPYLDVVLDRAMRDIAADAAQRVADPMQHRPPIIPTRFLDLEADGQSYVMIDGPIDAVMENASRLGALQLEQERKRRKSE